MSTQVFFFLPKPTAAKNYREAYPYGPNAGTFHADLGVEIDPGARAASPALAVVDGMVRWVPDPTPAVTGTLILAPSPLQLQDLQKPAGAGVMLFIYRNLDVESSRPFFVDWLVYQGGTSLLKDETPKARMDRFLRGEFNVWIVAGSQLALAAVTSSSPGWGKLGFEIIHVPSGSLGAQGSAGYNRVIDWTHPESLNRRLDPAAFYARVVANTSGAVLAPDHAGHPLLATLSRRTLLELRDEYDRPFEGGAEVKSGTTSIACQFPPENRGTCVLPLSTLGLGGATFDLSVANHVLTNLPSGPKAMAVLHQTLAVPDHWSVQALFMVPEPSEDDELKSWFVANTSGLPRYTEGNRVTAIRDGIAVFGEMVAAMRTVTSVPVQESFIYLANWWLNDSFELIDGDPVSTIANLTLSAALQGAQVRAMLWNQIALFNSYQNDAEVKHINALPAGRGRAILDGDVLGTSGSHHQKILIIKGSEGALAFCGGVDISTDRRDSPSHGALGGFHDVHARIDGPAVANIHKSFIDRWNYHPANEAKLSELVSTPAPAGSTFVQVARTYAPRMAYPFAPQGSLTPRDAFLRAIHKSKKFIYIEDQYLAPYPNRYPGSDPADETQDSVGILNALRKALGRTKDPIDYLLIVIPNYADLSWFQKIYGKAAGQARYRRRQFIQGLLAVAPNKVHVFYLGRRKYPPKYAHGSGELAEEGGSDTSSGGADHRDEIYVHSKVWIVDDVCAKIGSANCNRRSYTHDSEMDVVMVDGAVNQGGRAFARNLRIDLWREHLGLSDLRAALLEDHMLALSFWLGPQSSRSHVHQYQHELDADDYEGNWDSVDPDGT
jgi:phosphatidylserine/phosphatidylglycerophosphate/cardiolipin synthase-like enzyme